MNFKKFLVFLHDVAATAVAWYAAFLLRFNFAIPPANVESLLWSMTIVVPLQALVFWWYGLYRSLWRFASLPDLRRIVLAVFVSAWASATALFLYRRLNQVPRSVLVLDPILLVCLMGASRFLYRSWKDGHLIPFRKLATTPVLVLGAGRVASMLLRELAQDGQWRVVGLMDDDATKKGRLLSGVPVLGPISELERHARERGVHQVILAIPSASPARRRALVETAAGLGLTVLTVPTLDDLLTGRISVSRVRRVELEDLLGRGRVKLNDAGLHELLTDRTVLVTGAGGSIGSELCRQIARFSPRLLVLYEANEYALYQVEQEFGERFPGTPVAALAGDVRDAARLDEVFQRHRPDVVFHAAAYKHVPLMENDNCWEAVRNNVLGTYRIARASIQSGVRKFVLISSDKAVNPTNVMGATKRMAEMVCQGLQTPGTGTRFVVVRFGNVLGSTGSVIPKFRDQIAKGGPVTVTDPDMTRFFMLIPEAAQLVLQAGYMAQGGEICVLEMGSPVRILDLARDMIRLSGFNHDEIKIVFTGLRPGEKLYEELLADQEQTLPTPHPKVRVAKARAVPPGWLDYVVGWVDSDARVADAEVKAEMKRLVPEYAPPSGAPPAVPAPRTAAR